MSQCEGDRLAMKLAKEQEQKKSLTSLTVVTRLDFSFTRWTLQFFYRVDFTVLQFVCLFVLTGAGCQTRHLIDVFLLCGAHVSL